MIKIQVKPAVQRDGRRAATWVGAMICTALLIVAGVMVALTMRSSERSTDSTRQISYLGLYERSMPYSGVGAAAFTATTGVRPNIFMYYSAWLEPFQASFAKTAAEQGAISLVQINPFNVSLAAIALGQYDGYLSAYAEAIHSYGKPVIVSFGHEMNGNWYPWGYTHTSPATFVAAWRHIVTLFRGLGVRNVTWLWTVNIIDTSGAIRAPSAWWPGESYVNWVGLDGYYYVPSWTFASLFGPTITAIRALTHDPILIAETGAAPGTHQAANIADLFAGVRLYGLLGFVWFDAKADLDWRLTDPAAVATFRQGARDYQRFGS